MRHPLLTLAALCALLAPPTLHAPHALAATPAAQATAPAAKAARVIVMYKSGGALMRALSAHPASPRYPQLAATLSQRTGIALTDGHPISERSQVVFAKGLSSAELAARLAADPDVEFAEPDQRRHIRSIPNDPLYPGNQISATPTVGQWYLRPPNSVNVSAINAETAWTTTTGTSSVVVAVLDTGVRFDHPDLVGKLYAGYDFISDTATANDGNGRDANASDPGDWVTQAEVDSDPTFQDCDVGDSSWHGTQVAGLVGAATNNGIGMASVGRNVMILPVRVLGKCGGFDSDIIAGMLWAGGLSSNPVANSHPAKVLNLSLGSAGSCTASYTNAISQLTAAGVTVVISAGNAEGLAVDTPANCSGVIAVAGVRHIGTKVGFSSLGPEVALSAPAGNCINLSGACLNPLLTTTNTGTTVPATNTYSDSFRLSLGTSFSAPLVAGTAGLMLSVKPALTPAQVKSTLQSTARAFPTSGAGATIPVCQAPSSTTQDECYCTTSTCGAGLLDTAAAVAAVAPPLAPTAPLSASTANPSVGVPVSLEASDATVAAGRSGTYLWTLATSGGATASFTSAVNGSTATLLPTAPGTVTVTLTVTDDLGVQTAASTMLTISNPPTAVIVPSSATVVAGDSVSLDGSTSSAVGGRSIAQYAWTISSGASFGSFLGATNASTAALQGTAAGTVVVTLTVTDSAGVQSTANSTITVTAAPVSSGGGGGGGGALGLPWLIALAAAVVAVRVNRRRLRD